MSQGYLTVIVVATKGELPEAGNSLIVTKDPERPLAVRVYWKGRRVANVTVSGTVDATLGKQSVVLIIDGQRVGLTLDDQYATFRGEELRINREYARIDYDAETDTVF